MLTLLVQNSKLLIMQEHRNVKIFLLKAIFRIDLKKLLWLKTLCRGHMLLVILYGEEIVATFYEKKKKICKKQVKKSLKLRKSNKMERKECDNFLTAGLIKKA